MVEFTLIYGSLFSQFIWCLYGIFLLFVLCFFSMCVRILHLQATGLSVSARRDVVFPPRQA
ncbi:hypothetical protein ES703_66026 [subsurface metagenome]